MLGKVLPHIISASDHMQEYINGCLNNGLLVGRMVAANG